MQNVWVSPSCLRHRLSQTIDHHRAEKELLEIIDTTKQRQFLHNDRRTHCGKMRTVWPYHSESHSYGFLNNTQCPQIKLIMMCQKWRIAILFLFCKNVSSNTLRVNLCRPKNFVLSILYLTQLTLAISHALFLIRTVTELFLHLKSNRNGPMFWNWQMSCATCKKYVILDENKAHARVAERAARCSEMSKTFIKRMLLFTQKNTEQWNTKTQMSYH